MYLMIEFLFLDAVDPMNQLAMLTIYIYWIGVKSKFSCFISKHWILFIQNTNIRFVFFISLMKQYIWWTPRRVFWWFPVGINSVRLPCIQIGQSSANWNDKDKWHKLPMFFLSVNLWRKIQTEDNIFVILKTAFDI